jgi:hypothetical protein
MTTGETLIGGIIRTKKQAYENVRSKIVIDAPLKN